MFRIWDLGLFRICGKFWVLRKRRLGILVDISPPAKIEWGISGCKAVAQNLVVDRPWLLGLLRHFWIERVGLVDCLFATTASGSTIIVYLIKEK